METPYTTCTADGCDEPARRNKAGVSMGTCAEHKPFRGRELGSRVLLPSGYVTVKTETGVVPEHRVVMEAELGRALVAGENVHHINGQRDDNRPENLELWVTAQPYGQRVPDLVAYLVEFHRDTVVNALNAYPVEA